MTASILLLLLQTSPYTVGGESGKPGKVAVEHVGEEREGERRCATHQRLLTEGRDASVGISKEKPATCNVALQVNIS